MKEDIGFKLSEVQEPRFFDESTVELVQANASDEMVARAAWVSTVGDESRTKEAGRIDGLINYLVREKHGSPLEHNSFTFYVKTPLFIRSEFHRHRIGWSYNEASGRYSQLKPDFFFPKRGRNLVQIGKTGAYEFVPGTDEQYDAVVDKIVENSTKAYEDYEELLELGVAKEVARMHLPLNLMTSFYATCNARSLMNFLALRTQRDNATFVSKPQFEIDEVASTMEEFFKQQMPITYKAWNQNGRVAP